MSLQDSHSYQTPSLSWDDHHGPDVKTWVLMISSIIQALGWLLLQDSLSPQWRYTQMFSYFIISNLFSLLSKKHDQNQNGTNVTYYFTVVLVFPSLMWFVLGPACLTSVQVVRVLGPLREHRCQMHAGSLLRPTSVHNSTCRFVGTSRPEPLFSNKWCLPQRVNLRSYSPDSNKVNV